MMIDPAKAVLALLMVGLRRKEEGHKRDGDPEEFGAHV
jgi:hypothetical protein